ncbi:unnamed protein product [Polarella glacialis]|uniref:Ion transport domain-containing protein n=1 Tax=Polarella glacialis TaxID=89957 RepID=A0A813D8P7_POLGL|nr:unnamed protein product [Polarella glacialis]
MPEECYNNVDTTLVLFFSFEYFTKLICSCFTRASVLDIDWALQAIVPDTDDSNNEAFQTFTWLESVQHFVSRPMNIIDFASIMPFWLELIMSKIPFMPLTFLRAFRLLRLFRVIKLGRFDQTLTVLGVTLAKSLTSVQVLMVWITLASLMIGAIMEQLEKGNAAFDTVPEAFWWVFSRMLGVQKSVPFAKGMSETLIGGILLCLMSGFQKILWILPLATIKANFSESWEEQTELQIRRAQVKEENLEMPGTTWVADTQSASGRLELWMVSGSEEIAVGAGHFPVPIREYSATTASLSVPVLEFAPRLFSSRQAPPSVQLEVAWTPRETGSGYADLPTGELKVEVVRGTNLDISLWKCRFLVAVSVILYFFVATYC